MTLAGSTSDTAIPHGPSSTRSTSASASSACFDAAYGPRNGQRAPAADRAHEHDPPAGSPERRQDGLEHRDLPDDVDLELAAKLGEGHELERGRDSDARVVHEPVKLSSDDRGGGLDLSRIRDVELDRLDAVLAELEASSAARTPP